MSTRCTLCSSTGETLLGTDGNIYVDGRFSIRHVLEEVWEYRNRFKKNFRWKYDYWTHVQIGTSVRYKIPELI